MPERSERKSDLVLAVDTSQPAASYAICRDGKVLSSLLASGEEPHSRTFFPSIEALLSHANVKLQDIGAFAAVTGPGSFTGLRVGISAVHGLAQTLGVPAYGLTTLDVLALVTEKAGRVLVVQDSVRGDVFLGLRVIDADRQMVRPVDDCYAPLVNLPAHWLPTDWRGSEVVAAGNAVNNQFVREWADAQSLRLSESAGATPLAEVLGCYVSRQLALGTDLSAYPLQACYIRPADAEVKAL